MPLFFSEKSTGRSPKNQAILVADNWDDFSFKTLFFLIVFDENGVEHSIGSVKIGYFGQTESKIKEKFSNRINESDNRFFSIGIGPEYYQNIQEKLSKNLSKCLLNSLHDLANDDELLVSAQKEQVFKTSFLRSISLSAIQGQFKRVLAGGALLTKFDFIYKKEQSNSSAEINLKFNVEPDSKPPTNIHILIGRNGVGKTTLLNNMISSIVNSKQSERDVGGFYEVNSLPNKTKISENYFSSVTSLSFSAFDPFVPLNNQPDRSKGTCYFYIGLKEVLTEKESKLKEFSVLCDEFIKSLKVCLALEKKKEQWSNAINELESDLNFSEMNLLRLLDIREKDKLTSEAQSLFKKMSSGHAVILLSLTKLVETVEEKTLVLIDEPESHLHPPLLSAFMRALSDLLINRNAVAIIATHSPVVLQEVPKKCVWKLRRTRLAGNADRPENETFGENVGILTREVFGLEVSKSGFHKLLELSVSQGNSYEEILREYENQIGFEGKAILKALISNREPLLEVDSNDNHQ
ncbi:Phage protein ea59 [uncultured Gammaproteobacteria bacterium]|jgi:predicted ATPase|nr:Phage protein ea59 [uncultured Gammaproteobacteria bacterium]